MSELDKKIRAAIVRRAYKLQAKKVYAILDDRPFILAGGALCGDAVHDFDLYPAPDAPYDIAQLVRKLSDDKSLHASPVCTTKNALTVLLDGGQTVQFCTYCKPSTAQLVQSFDFSHVQVGARFAGHGAMPTADDVFYTDAFVLANVTRSTEYTGSEYPLGSIVRTLKYYKRGKLTRATAARGIIKMLADVLNRGYSSYADFKDQLDAIDLGVPECAEANALYSAAMKRGLVNNS